MMKRFAIPLLSAVLLLCPARAVMAPVRGNGPLVCSAPPCLQPGDKVALVSPSYFTPIKHVVRAAQVLREWGFEPVIAPNVGKKDAGKYAGTAAERTADLRWALGQPDVKAILCNTGGYGTVHLLDDFQAGEWAASPKWLIGYSDITTLLGMEVGAGVMGIHGTMGRFLAKSGGADTSAVLLRDILLGELPRYELPPHPQNRCGQAKGTLVGGNLSTLVSSLDTWADVTRYDNIVLFVEDVEESMHHIDRLFRMLRLRGVPERCAGVILGGFTDCGNEFDYGTVEAMLRENLQPYGIPVLCGFPAGHTDVNLPLVMGASVTLDVREDGATLAFDVPGMRQRAVQVTETSAPVPEPAENGGDFVTLTDVVPGAILEIRYYSTFNFVGTRIDGYEEPLALMTRQAADSLKVVSEELLARGYRLKIYDAYRPQCAVDHFIRWSRNASDTLTKRYFYPALEKERLFELGYVARRSSHSRGSTVDLTLFDMAAGKDVDMGGPFDWFGPESHPDCGGNPDTQVYRPGGPITEAQFRNRMLLRTAMLRHGFLPYAGEWWHFTLAHEPYPDTYFNFPVAGL
ncbi:MAG: LD-carboxypeptidase [Bacteroidales bacterium]|nr:LD-carboxypeptidase [Bacteroidales bacterium]